MNRGPLGFRLAVGALFVVLIIWARGCVYEDSVSYCKREPSGSWYASLDLRNSGVYFYTQDSDGPHIIVPDADGLMVHSSRTLHDGFINHSCLGFLAHTSSMISPRPFVYTYNVAAFGLPTWFLVLICLSVVIWRYRMFQRMAKHALRLICEKCGGHLHVDHAECPACQAPVSKFPDRV